MIHGMWCAGWCWENYVRHFEARGYRCIAPTLRYHDADPGAVPHPLLGTTGLRDYVSDLETTASGLGLRPIIMGHSMGGLLAQLLASRIQARALVLLAPASPSGVLALAPSVIRAFLSLPAKGTFWKKPHKQTFHEAAYSVFNLMPVREQRKLHAKYVYESGRAISEIGLWPLDRRKASSVDASKITCPVLTVVGTHDRIIPPFSVRKVAAKYKATHKEFADHAHWLLGEQGWQDIAAYVSDWLDHADSR